MQQIIKQLTERCDQYSSELPHEHNEPSYFQLWGRFDELRRVLRELKELEATPVVEGSGEWKEAVEKAAREYACEETFEHRQSRADFKVGAEWAKQHFEQQLTALQAENAELRKKNEWLLNRR